MEAARAVALLRHQRLDVADVGALYPAWLPAAAALHYITLSTPRVCVVMATHNRPQFLRRSAARVIQQDYANVELVVLDDSAQCAATRSFVASGDVGGRRRVVYLCHRGERLSIGDKRNRGMRACSSDAAYIAMWDDDDYYSRRRLSRQIAALEAAAAAAPATSLVMFNHSRVLDLPRMQVLRLREGVEWGPSYGTMLFFASAAARASFADVSLGEDVSFVDALAKQGDAVALAAAGDDYIYVRHRSTWRWSLASFADDLEAVEWPLSAGERRFWSGLAVAAADDDGVVRRQPAADVDFERLVRRGLLHRQSPNYFYTDAGTLVNGTAVPPTPPTPRPTPLIALGWASGTHARNLPDFIPDGDDLPESVALVCTADGERVVFLAGLVAVEQPELGQQLVHGCGLTFLLDTLPGALVVRRPLGVAVYSGDDDDDPEDDPQHNDTLRKRADEAEYAWNSGERFRVAVSERVVLLEAAFHDFSVPSQDAVAVEWPEGENAAFNITRPVWVARGEGRNKLAAADLMVFVPQRTSRLVLSKLVFEKTERGGDGDDDGLFSVVNEATALGLPLWAVLAVGLFCLCVALALLCVFIIRRRRRYDERLDEFDLEDEEDEDMDDIPVHEKGATIRRRKGEEGEEEDSDGLFPDIYADDDDLGSFDGDDDFDIDSDNEDELQPPRLDGPSGSGKTPSIWSQATLEREGREGEGEEDEPMAPPDDDEFDDNMDRMARLATMKREPSTQDLLARPLHLRGGGGAPLSDVNLDDAFGIEEKPRDNIDMLLFELDSRQHRRREERKDALGGALMSPEEAGLGRTMGVGGGKKRRPAAAALQDPGDRRSTMVAPDLGELLGVGGVRDPGDERGRRARPQLRGPGRGAAAATMMADPGDRRSTLVAPDLGELLGMGGGVRDPGERGERASRLAAGAPALGGGGFATLAAGGGGNYMQDPGERGVRASRMMAGPPDLTGTLLRGGVVDPGDNERRRTLMLQGPPSLAHLGGGESMEFSRDTVRAAVAQSPRGARRRPKKERRGGGLAAPTLAGDDASTSEFDLGAAERERPSARPGRASGVQPHLTMHQHATMELRRGGAPPGLPSGPGGGRRSSRAMPSFDLGDDEDDEFARFGGGGGFDDDDDDLANVDLGF